MMTWFSMYVSNDFTISVSCISFCVTACIHMYSTYLIHSLIYSSFCHFPHPEQLRIWEFNDLDSNWSSPRINWSWPSQLRPRSCHYSPLTFEMTIKSIHLSFPASWAVEHWVPTSCYCSLHNYYFRQLNRRLEQKHFGDLFELAYLTWQED